MKSSNQVRRLRQTALPDGFGPIAVTAIKKLGLTERETEVLCWLASGKTNQEIATILGLSFFTVKTHVTNILHRLDVDTRTAAAAVLFRVLRGEAK